MLIRIGFAWLFGILISNKVITPELAAQLTDSAVSWIVLGLLAIAPIIWSYLQKRYSINLFKYALAVPAHTTEEQVKDLVAKNEPPPVPV
ncbi:MAG: hypothetical protein M3367_03085 [Acidobacteriota bacterium]|nr:hypothetical protein [Acidobacteriota bacterium]